MECRQHYHRHRQCHPRSCDKRASQAVSLPDLENHHRIDLHPRSHQSCHQMDQCHHPYRQLADSSLTGRIDCSRSLECG